MIICQNCGTTNNEATSHTCRTCGALLPVSSKRSRVRGQKISREKKKEIKQINQKVKESAEKEEVVQDKLDLKEIPQEDIEKEPLSDAGSSEILQEIAPQPYKSSIMDSGNRIISPLSPLRPPSQSRNAISNAFIELKSSVLDDQKVKPEIPLSPIPLESTESDEAVLKQKRLEKDMAEVLGFLSKKISVKKLEITKVDPTKKKEPKDKIQPSSMNEILKRLLTLDLNIEASAIIKTDGTILASSISSGISDSLFATIGMNISMIGSDIIEGLDAGVLKSISVRGTEGVLDLAPIDRENPSVKDMILVLFSHPKFKSGIISFAIDIVKKQLREYLGLEK